ncbi:MAG: PAS domain S-box protein [Desulforhopalus sp.]|jgi:PAS domain S-box-containing protein|nr:PAS domain S-box protein [Desulforhopalus sp.]
MGKNAKDALPRFLGMPFAAGISLFYLAIAGLWIFFSDRVIILIARTPDQLLFLSTAKGWFFVVFTALLLFFLLKRFTSRIEQVTLSLRASRERHRITLQAIGDAVIATDREGHIELINPVAEELTGWRAAEAVGKPMAEVFHIINEQTGEKGEDPVAMVLRQGTIVGLANHTLLIGRDGLQRPIADSGAPIRNEQGELTGVVVVFRDQSAERQAAKILQENEKNLLEAQAIAHVGSWRIDLDSGTVSGSAEARRIYGLDKTELTLETIQAIPLPPYRAQLDAALDNLVNQGIPYDIEFQICRPVDRALRHIHTVAQYDRANNTVIGTIHDITERVKLEEQLRQAQKLESVGRLAGGVAHDFNNMLSVILGYSELALTHTTAGTLFHDYLTAIDKAARRSADITRQLLAFARKQTIAPRLLSLNETVEGMLTMLRRLIGEDIDLTWMPEADLWPVKLDPVQIDQILANLCVNARDAITGPGKITLETRTIHLDETDCLGHHQFRPGDFVLLALSDNGSGMDQQTLENLFEPFFTTKDVDKGTGLGLAMVYGIVKQNNGFITVDSEPGRGTTFRIYLPRHEGEVLPLETLKTEQMPYGLGQIVFIVEDERVILELGKKMLERLNYRVLAASTPKEALELAAGHQETIELLLTDVIMPEMNGRDLASLMIRHHPRLKTVFMSGYTANVIAHHGVLDQGFYFLQKPFTLHNLATTLQAALQET